MIEIIITGNTNKGKIALAAAIFNMLKEVPELNVSFPLVGFKNEEARERYAQDSFVAGDLEGNSVVITTIKKEKHSHIRAVMKNQTQKPEPMQLTVDRTDGNSKFKQQSFEFTI